MKKRVCFGCEERRVGCHGKKEDGTWICEKWGKEQKTQEETKRHVKEQNILNSYFADFKKEKMRKEKEHHAYR